MLCLGEEGFDVGQGHVRVCFDFTGRDELLDAIEQNGSLNSEGGLGFNLLQQLSFGFLKHLALLKDLS